MVPQIGKWLVLIVSIFLASYGTIRCSPLDLNNAPSYLYRISKKIPNNIAQDRIPENFQLGNRISKLDSGLSTAVNGQQSNVRKCGDRKASSPIQEEYVYGNDYRVSHTTYRTYTLTWGNQTDNNIQAFGKEYYLKNTTQLLKIHFQDPNGRLINFIYVENPKMKKTKLTFEDYVRITEGGINCSYVTMTIGSDGDPIHRYKVFIFVEE